MMKTHLLPLVLAVCCMAPPVGAAFLVRWQVNRSGRRSEAPFDQLRRRPAGESLRCQIEQVDQRLLTASWLMMGTPMVFADAMAGKISRRIFLIGGVLL